MATDVDDLSGAVRHDRVFRPGTVMARGAAPLWVVVAVAALVHCLPSLGAMLIYERSAVDGGEYWRLFTSSLVHFSWAHLAGDAAVVLLAGSLLSGRRASEVWTLVGGAALAAGVAVLLLAPGLARYGGLSGIAHAVVVYGALGGVVRPGWRRVPAVLVVAIVAGKLALDASVVRPMSASYAGATVVVASASHLGAVAFAVLFFAAGAAVRDVRRSRRTPPHPSRAVP